MRSQAATSLESVIVSVIPIRKNEVIIEYRGFFGVVPIPLAMGPAPGWPSPFSTPLPPMVSAVASPLPVREGN